jgi:hypothetical protein
MGIGIISRIVKSIIATIDLKVIQAMLSDPAF